MSETDVGTITYYYKNPPEVPETMPYRVSGVYVDDLNIIDIHHFILEKMRISRNHSDNPEEIENICIRYKKEVMPYLDAYYKLGRTPKVISFTTKKKNSESDESDKDKDRVRLMIIAFFLSIADKYIVMDILHNVEVTNLNCPSCDQPLDDDGSGMQVCESCGFERIGFNIDENMSSHRNGYQDRENFIKALAKYQGKIVPDKEVVNEVVQLLDEHFASYGRDTGEVIRQLPLNKRGRKNGTSKELMYQALSDIQKPLYDFTNYFCYVYWGWKLPDVTHLESQILSDYDKTQVILDGLPKDRKSSLNTQFRLLKHLELVGYPCSQDDFRVIKTRSILEDHNELWYQMVTGAGLKFIATI
jgi:hypothetical protein